jgi:hypothetical protein
MTINIIDNAHAFCVADSRVGLGGASREKRNEMK